MRQNKNFAMQKEAKGKNIFPNDSIDFEDLSPGTSSENESPVKNPWASGLKYFIIGIWFGILLTKSEAISWFRIQEMFRLQSFHMYGLIGSAVVVGIISIALMKKFSIKTIYGNPIVFPQKRFHRGQVYGGLIFGFGWAITGACPGPLFAQIGTGATVVSVTLLSAIAGTWVYGYMKNRLPH